MQYFLTYWLIPAVVILGAYAIGSIPTGVWYSKWIHHEDVRSLGSGNSGGTNIGRNYGLKAAIIVIILDALKGLIPIALVRYFAPDQAYFVMLTGIASILGHAYPLWANFRGGKIVATSIGVLIGFNPWVGLIQVLFFLALLFVTSTVSLSALVSYSAMAIIIAFIANHWTYRVGFILIAAFMCYRHHENIQRLMQGTERRIRWGMNPPDTK